MVCAKCRDRRQSSPADLSLVRVVIDPEAVQRMWIADENARIRAAGEVYHNGRLIGYKPGYAPAAVA